MDGGKQSPAPGKARAKATRDADARAVAGAVSGIAGGFDFKSMLAVADALLTGGGR